MIRRSSVYLPVLSVFLGLILFFVFRFSGFSEFPRAAPDESYAAVAVSGPRKEASPGIETPGGIPEDSEIREKLELLGLEGVISESTQRIPMDDFGVMKTVPLDTYRDEIESFDPRDDGYAAKLKAFFIRGDTRFLFVPLDKRINTPAKLRKIPAALKEYYSCSVIFPGRGEPFFLYPGLLLAAAIAVCVFSRPRRLFVYGLPILAAFGWGGPPAIPLAGILAGVRELGREPLRELLVSGNSGRGDFDYAGAGWKGILERLRPFRKNLGIGIAFFAFFPLVCRAGELPFFPALLGTAFFFIVSFLSFREETGRPAENRHVLFTPVILFPRGAKTFSLFPVLFPFFAAALFAVFLPAALPGFSPAPEDGSVTDARYIVSAGDYSRHIAFQKSFSYRPLGSEAVVPAAPEETGRDYPLYRLDGDGLIMSGPEYSGEGGGPARDFAGEEPPFPLEKLMEFLIQYSKAPGSLSRNRGDLFAVPGRWFAALGSAIIQLKLWIAITMIFAVCVFNLFRSGIGRNKKKRNPALRDKRIAA